MYLHGIPSDYERLVLSAKAQNTTTELYDDNVSVQDQVEQLRIKISLKERCNNVLHDEMEESRLLESTIIHDLLEETNDLRVKFIEALELEKKAMTHALRSHRNFQLAMKSQTAGAVIPWLDDKLFDMAKHLNCLLHRLATKRSKLEEVEQEVQMMEKWPLPGSRPWELDLITQLHKLEYDIDNMKVKLETASILHSRYYEIKFILREERGKYIPYLKSLQMQLQGQRDELKQLKKMFAQAIIFNNDATKKLAITEKEASENRRRRRGQMTRVKKAVRKILETNQLTNTKKVLDSSDTSNSGNNNNKGGAMVTILHDHDADLVKLRLKKLQVEKFEDRTRRLVEIMKVTDLTHMPSRYRTVMGLGQRFEQEEQTKQDLRDTLLRQQNMLNLVLCHFLYTGQKEESEFCDFRNEFEVHLTQIDEDIQYCKSKLHRNGELVVSLRLALLALLERFDDQPNKLMRTTRYGHLNLMTQIKILYKKVQHLMNSVRDLEAQVPEEEDENGGNEDTTKNYSQFIKPYVTPTRLVRVGNPPVDVESDAEEEFADLRVPTSWDIKAKSSQLVQQGKLKRIYV